MAQDKKQVRGMFLAFCAFYPFFRILLTLIGLAALFLKLNIAPSAPVLAPIIQQLCTSDLAKGLIMVGLTSVIFTIIDSFLHAIGVTLVHDVLKPMLGKRIKNEITWIKGLTVLLSLLTCGLVLLTHESLTRISSYGLAIFSLFAVPLLAGIIGLKTTTKSFWIALLCALIGPILLYIGASDFLSNLKWRDLRHYIWLSAIITSALGFFVSHYIQHKGFMMVQRSQHTSQEQLWVPSLKSRQKINTYGSEPMLFAWFLCIFYMLPDLDGNLADYSVVSLRALGVVLCAGLLLQGLWPAVLKPYFDLYWFFTLLYCLLFASTLLFLLIQSPLLL